MSCGGDTVCDVVLRSRCVAEGQPTTISLELSQPTCLVEHKPNTQRVCQARRCHFSGGVLHMTLGSVAPTGQALAQQSVAHLDVKHGAAGQEKACHSPKMESSVPC